MKIIIFILAMTLQSFSFANEQRHVRKNELIPPTKLTAQTVINWFFIYLNGSTAIDVCEDKNADLIVEGAVKKYRLKKNGSFSKYYSDYTFSNINDKDFVVGCQNHVFKVELFKRVPKLDARGTIVGYELVPSDTNVNVGKVDKNCHLTIDSRVQLDKPDMRLIVKAINLHNNYYFHHTGELSRSLVFDCALIKGH